MTLQSATSAPQPAATTPADATAVAGALGGICSAADGCAVMPVTFPVALAPGAPKGTQTVKANLVFFYCSKREGWCRRGSDELEVLVSVP